MTRRPKSLFQQFDELIADSLLESVQKLSEEDRQKISKITDADMQEMINDVSVNLSAHYVETITGQQSENYQSDRRQKLQFEANLQKTYSPYFEHLHSLTETCAESIQHHRDYLHEQGIEKRTKQHIQYSVLVRLHARVLRLSNEIRILMESGYGAGALARWRAMHEIVTTISYLVKNPGATEIFLEHNKVLSYRAMTDYNRYAEALGVKPFSPREVAGAKRSFQNAVRKHTKAIDHDYGWLRVHTGNKIGNFRELEEQYGQSQLRPYYRYASYGIHTNSKSLFSGEEFSALEEQGILLVGASDAGMEDVAQLTPISLTYATIVILTGVSTSLGGMIMAMVVEEKQRQLAKAFSGIKLPDEKLQSSEADK